MAKKKVTGKTAPPASRSKVSKTAGGKSGAAAAAGKSAAGRKTGAKPTAAARPTVTVRKPAGKVAAAPSSKVAAGKQTPPAMSPKPTPARAAAPRPAATRGSKGAATGTVSKAAPATTEVKPLGPEAAPKAGADTPTEAPSPGGSRRGRAAPPPPAPAAPDSDGYVLINGRRVRMLSAAAKIPPRKVSSRAPAPESNAAAAIDARRVKSRLNKKQLDEYRRLLLEKRAQLVGDLSAMEEQALHSSGGNLSHMPIHMADIGTDTYDQDFMLGLAETERQGLREIDEALRRIDDGTYGVCQLTGKPIPRARLLAKPWAKYTIEAAREIERGLGH